jgi:hypothetical protein
MVRVCDASGIEIARGQLRQLDGERCELEIEDGAARLRHDYFLEGTRTVDCCLGDRIARARLSTCWQENRRVWFLCFRGLDVEELVRVPAKATVAA